MHLQVPPQNTLLLWQLNSHKHIDSIPELLRCCTIIVMTLNLMHVQVFRLRRKSHSLLDDPRISICKFVDLYLLYVILTVFFIVLKMATW